MAPPDLFLRLLIHNRQGLSDAGALKHYKPPASHWKTFVMGLLEPGLLHSWIYYAAQKALITTIAVIPAMDLRKISIQHAQRIIYNLLQTNLDFMMLKRHNAELEDSLLGSTFKIQLAQCTEIEMINNLIYQE